MFLKKIDNNRTQTFFWVVLFALINVIVSSSSSLSFSLPFVPAEYTGKSLFIHKSITFVYSLILSVLLKKITDKQEIFNHFSWGASIIYVMLLPFIDTPISTTFISILLLYLSYYTIIPLETGRNNLMNIVYSSFFLGWCLFLDIKFVLILPFYFLSILLLAQIKFNEYLIIFIHLAFPVYLTCGLFYVLDQPFPPQNFFKEINILSTLSVKKITNNILLYINLLLAFTVFLYHRFVFYMDRTVIQKSFFKIYIFQWFCGLLMGYLYGSTYFILSLVSLSVFLFDILQRSRFKHKWIEYSAHFLLFLPLIQKIISFLLENW